MMIFKKAIPRRAFLKGAGVSLALPLLDSMTPAFASALDTSANPTIRLSTVYVPNGRIPKSWTPDGEGPLTTMSPTLEPLAPFKEQITVLTGLNIKAADPVGNEPGGVHARPAAAFLTGIHPKPGGSVGISMDQLVAKHYGNQTQLESLELGLDSPEFAVDDGSYSSYYMNTISWRNGNTPLPMEINPRAVFERMFGDSNSASAAERFRQARRERSILDSVSDGVSRLLKGVGPSDQVKLDQYLDALRDIERRIQVAEKENASAQQTATNEKGMERPVGIPTLYSEHAKLMFDLQVVAFQTDMTRVVTMMMGREQTDRPFREIGIRDGHHPLSHHKEMPEIIALVAQIDLFQCQLFSHFVEKMHNTPDGDGSLLDHSIIIYGSALSDGNYHVHNNVPVLVAGRAAGQIKSGRHIRYNGLPLSNLHLAALDMLKVPTEPFLDNKYSDATGELQHLSL